MKVVTVVGARPQFIKAAAVSRVMRDEHSRKVDEVLVHTGQHYDGNMSQVFFDELDILRPRYNLEISGGNHGVMTGRMLGAIESVLLQEKPDWVLIYGDTNSTLAGALAAAKLNIPIAHVEAGLRSFNMRMPEEVNRIIADRVSILLFCPTETAVNTLASEGMTNGVSLVGDVMYDAALFYRDKASQQSRCLQQLNLHAGSYALATCHRTENTDNPDRLSGIVSALGEIAEQIPVVLPIHPRTRKLLADHGMTRMLGKVVVTDPLPFLDMITLEQSAKVILTDSGGVQKEAFFYSVPCITMRDETEWVETVNSGANLLAGASHAGILEAFERVMNRTRAIIDTLPYGDGNAAGKIVDLLVQ